MYISIGAAPASVMAGTAFIMSKRYGSRQVGLILIGSGIILLIGMFVANSTISRIDSNYRIYIVGILPQLFMVISVAIMASGAFLLRTKKRPIKEFF